jgi:hypothetical protein
LVPEAEIAADPGQALRFWGFLCDLWPDWAYARLKAADLALTRGQHGQAGLWLKQASEADQSNPWYWDLRQIDDWGMACASDGRGCGPYRLTIDGKPLNHVQWPTTLPTLDELIGNPGIDEDNVPQTLLRLTESDRDQVFTLHAELEGGLLAPAFERLLAGWVAQGHQLVSLAELHQHTNVADLPCVPVVWGSVPGRSGELITDATAA